MKPAAVAIAEVDIDSKAMLTGSTVRLKATHIVASRELPLGV